MNAAKDWNSTKNIEGKRHGDIKICEGRHKDAEKTRERERNI